MKYLSTFEIAEKWGISPRRVGILCNQDRIPGAQRAGRERDYETCQACCSKQKVQGHHIFDHQFSGEATAENIVSLCYDCHKKVHSGKLDICKF